MTQARTLIALSLIVHMCLYDRGANIHFFCSSPFQTYFFLPKEFEFECEIKINATVWNDTAAAKKAQNERTNEGNEKKSIQIIVQ